MKKLNVVSLALLVLFMGMMISCTKTGPAGAAGTNGAAGATGATGATGPDSVQYSPWITLTFVQTVDMNNNTVLVDTILAPSLDSSILNKGLVLGYIYAPTNVVSGDSSIYNVDNTWNFVVQQVPKVGKIILYTYTWENLNGYKYRFVLVPGNVPASGVSVQQPTKSPAQLKGIGYSTLSNLFHIPAEGSSLRVPSAQ